jgi:hypothetical protein
LGGGGILIEGSLLWRERKAMWGGREENISKFRKEWMKV